MLEPEQWSHRGADGLVLRAWRTPPRGLPVIFFLHGNGLCGRVYWPMLRHLSDDYDIWMLDAPGHGASDSSGQFRGWYEDAVRCFEAIDAAAADYAGVEHHLVAHSYGAILSTMILADYPGRFRSAVLLDPVFFPPTMLALGRMLDVLGLLKYHKLARTTRNRRDRWPSLDAVREHLLGKSIYARWQRECFEAYLRDGFKAEEQGTGLRLNCDKSIEAKIFGSMPWGLPMFVVQVTTPCVVISGDQSYDFVQKGVPKYCAGHPYLRHRLISGGHNFMLERCEAAAQWVRESL